MKNRIGKIEIAGQIIDREAMEQARQQWDSVAKPLNSLGKLEELIIQIAGIQKTPHIKLQKKEVLVYCADNGVVAEGISQSDSSVTSMVAHSMAEGRANINIMAGQAGAKVTPVDVGMKDVVNHAGLIQHKIMPGTRNFAKEPAMRAEQCQQAILTGRRCQYHSHRRNGNRQYNDFQCGSKCITGQTCGRNDRKRSWIEQ